MALTPSFGSIKPSQKQQILESNFLSFNGGAGAGDSNSFAQQYLPEIYEQEVERYGNRTLSGFLRMVGAEMPMTSDQVIWSEQNRLHVAYNDVSNDGTNTLTFAVGGAGDAFVENVISKNQTIVILDPAGLELKALVTESSQAGVLATVEVAPYTAANTGALAATGLKIFVYGSEYGKGSSVVNSTGAADVNGYKSITPSFTQFSNSPVIIRNKYVVSGSDMAQIGWVEVATEDGTSGYLWYLKAESETRLRFEDYLEMSVVEGEKAAAGSGAATAGVKGTQGLFAAIKDRGNTNVGFTAAGGLATFDEILKNLDTQGAIEENMLFLNRQTSLDFDDMLAGVGAADNGIYAGGSSYGVFENSEDMALNLGFSGFRRGSYDFYKTDWKYLNDASTRGAIQGAVASVEGVLIPAGTSTVYDQILGTNIRRPFLHVRYRASQADDRKMKTWLTGSAGGAVSSDLDAMEVNFLSERCLCVQGANNFVLFQGV
ncbi:hypothetical protein N9216_01645 [Pseudomonadales bacterium]|nr:hypothetical protein [Pseudomonadales bacterium]